MTVSVLEIKRKNSTAIRIDYREPGGRRVQRVFGRASSPEALEILRKQAADKAREIELELRQGRYQPLRGELKIDDALAEFGKYLEGSNRSRDTVANYFSTLRKFRRFIATTKATQLKDVTPQLCLDFIEWQGNVKPNTLRLSLGRMRTMFNWLIRRKELWENSWSSEDVRAFTPATTVHDRSPTPEELDALLKHSSRNMHDLILVLSQTGLRRGELLNLRWMDVHLADDDAYLRVVVQPDWKPKTKSSIRSVPLSEEVVDCLRDRLRALTRIEPNSKVFHPSWKVGSIVPQFRALRLRAGCDAPDEKGQQLRLHSLRHYYGSTLAMAGINPATVRDLMGHSSILQTDRYFTMPRSELFGAVHKTFSRTRTAPGSDGHGRPKSEKVVRIEDVMNRK